MILIFMRKDIYFSGLVILIVGIVIFYFEAIATVIMAQNLSNPVGALSQSYFLVVYGKLFKLIGAIISVIGISTMIYSVAFKEKITK